MITQITMVTAMISILSSSLLPGMFMKDYDDKADSEDGYTNGRKLVLDLMKVQAYVVTGVATLGFILFREKPPTPPSFTAEQKREAFGPSLKLLFRNRNYFLTFLTYSLFCGSFLSNGVTMSFLFKPFGFKTDANTFAGLAMVLCGILGSGIGGKMFRSHPKFRLFIVIGTIGTIIGNVLILIFLPIGNFYLIQIPYILIGFVSLQAFPIFLELASEIAYPVSETISSGLLQGGSNLLGFALGDDDKTSVMIVQVCNIAVFAICVILVKILKVELNRSKVDAQHEKGLKIVEENNEESGNKKNDKASTFVQEQNTTNQSSIYDKSQNA